MRKTILILLGLLLAAAGLGSCSTVRFYSQAAGGQWEILRKAQPIPEITATPETEKETRQRLELVEELRAFAASELGLPADQQFTRYTDLKRRYAVWAVYAAPEFSMEGKTWWYPLVGSLKYRGFFSETLANAEAENLRKDGYDVFVGGVEAYSTLGWFRDPVLNTFLKRSDADLAELIFHELTHKLVYVSGDTDFNEALATSVGEEGARRWLKARGREADLRKYQRETAVMRDFIALIKECRERLKTSFAATENEPFEVRRQAKERILAQLRTDADAMNRRWGGTLRMEKWFAKPINNARLNTIATYYDLVPAFEKRLAAHGGDLKAFYHEVEEMKHLSKKERRERLGR